MNNWLTRRVQILPKPPTLVVPERYADTTQEQLPTPLATLLSEYLFGFWTHAPKGIAPLLLGRAFTWKTAAAVVLAKQIQEVHKVAVTFVSVPDKMIQLELNRFSEETRQMLARWKLADFLILDDFATVEPKSFGHDVLKSLIAARFDSTRPTVWTGNVELDAKDPFKGLGLAYGPLMGRRLQQGAEGFTVVTG